MKSKYKRLKQKYLEADHKNQKLKGLLDDCSKCKALAKANQNTKQALAEAVGFTSLLLQELYKYAS